MGHGTSHFTVVTRFVLFCGDRVEVDGRRGEKGPMVGSSVRAKLILKFDVSSLPIIKR